MAGHDRPLADLLHQAQVRASTETTNWPDTGVPGGAQASNSREWPSPWDWHSASIPGVGHDHGEREQEHRRRPGIRFIPSGQHFLGLLQPQHAETESIQVLYSSSIDDQGDPMRMRDTKGGRDLEIGISRSAGVAGEVR
jgi:hypothetical protein